MKKTIASAAALAAAVIGTGTVNSIANADTIETTAKNETTVKNDVKTSCIRNPKSKCGIELCTTGF